MKTIKLITKQEVQKLIKHGFLKHTHLGYINRNGFHVGFSQTVNKMYIEDRYADEAKGLK